MVPVIYENDFSGVYSENDNAVVVFCGSEPQSFRLLVFSHELCAREVSVKIQKGRTNLFLLFQTLQTPLVENNGGCSMLSLACLT